MHPTRIPLARIPLARLTLSRNTHPRSADDADTAAVDTLISPCACKGSQQWVHRRCLQACQVAGFATARRESCGVCLSRYSEQLDVPAPPELQAGNLLLASPELMGTFKNAVILMCEFGQRVDAETKVAPPPRRRPARSRPVTL